MRFIPAREDVNTPDPYRSGNTLQWEAFEECPPGHVSWWTAAATPAPPPAGTC